MLKRRKRHWAPSLDRDEKGGNEDKREVAWLVVLDREESVPLSSRADIV